MAITPLRILLFLGGASGAAFGTAYTMGAFDPVASQPPGLAASPGGAATALQETPKAEEQAALQEKPAQQAADPTAAAPAEPTVPSFDLLRAEPDGSVVIAGKAAAGADIEILSGGKVLGRTKATPEGDFAAVLDEPLKPGDYQISLRSTTSTKVAADSKETAVVSIPDGKDGQVLAMVEQPGASSRIITRPDAGKATPPAQTAAAGPSEPAVQSETSPSASSDPANQSASVAVEAVEIEGKKMFIAGAAPAGAAIRVYANDQLLGETRSTPAGRFLLELQRDLPVGDYRVRADALAGDGKTVVARAEVDFSREPGESIAAVTPAGQSSPGSEPKGAQQARPSEQQAAQPDRAPSTPAQPTGSATQLASAPDEPATLPAVDQPPKLQSVSGGVIIRRGDSLWRISRRVYGRGVRYSTIYLANDTQIRDPNRIYPGQVFRVPDKTTEGEAADMKTMGDQATTVE